VNADSHSETVRSEFGRTASVVTKRTAGRFDSTGAVEFSQLRNGDSVLEVGVGTGVFLSLFSEVAGLSIGVDLTEEMLHEARRNNVELVLAVGDGHRLPLRSKAVDLATSAQTLHHVPDPVPFIAELRRVTKDDGRVLIVDQVATERYEEALFMNKLETIRDPSHAASRSQSVMRSLMMTAGLEIVGEKVIESRSTFASWMPPEEFSDERIQAARDFIDRFGSETGMVFGEEDGELSFTRRRMMLLARRTPR
jgi:ubiquinone/menaquinone biosynthesis C-methylase UbiE